VGDPGGIMKHEPQQMLWFMFTIHDMTISGENNENNEKEVGEMT